MHRALHDRGVDAAGSYGLVRSELIAPVPGVQDDTVALLTFTGRDALDAWLDAPVRREVLAAMEHLTDGTRSVNVVGSFAGWFGNTQPRRWKQALAVILGLIPVSLLITLTREAVAPGLPLAGAIVVNAVGNVCLLTWLVMPVLTRTLRPWLTR